MRQNRARQGFATALVLVAVSVMLVLVFAAAGNASHCMRTSSADTEAGNARLVAEAGINDAITYLRATPGWTTGFNKKAMPSIASSTYTVTVTPGGSTAPDGTVVPAADVYLISKGSTVNATREVSVMLQASSSGMFNWGTFGNSAYEIGSGAMYDSYNSNNGPYSHANSGSLAVIGTNASIEVESGARVNGTAYAPTVTVNGQQVIQVEQANGSQVDTVAAMPQTVVLAPVDATPKTPNADTTGITYSPNPAPYNTSTGNLTVAKNQTVTLSEGTYYFNDMTIKNSGKLIIKGKVVVYVAGLVNFQSGSNINYLAKDGTSTSGVAANFQIYSSSTSNSAVTIDGGSDLVTAIYAPNGGFVINNGGDYYGSVIANSIKNEGGSKFHYDVALKNVPVLVQGSTTTATILSWDRH